MFTVRIDDDAAVDMLRVLEQKELPRVVGRTLTRTMNSAKSATSRFLRNRINLQKRVIDKSIKTRRSNEIQNLTALALGRAWFELIWTGKPIPLRDYAATRTTRGASYKVAKSGRRKVYVRQGRKGFIIDSLGGHVYVRTGPDPEGPAKAPIKKVYGPSIPQFAVTRKERQAIIEHARRFWAEDLQRNIRFAIANRSRF